MSLTKAISHGYSLLKSPWHRLSSGGRSNADDQEAVPLPDNIEFVASYYEIGAKRVQRVSSAAADPAKAPVRVRVRLVKEGPSEREGSNMNEVLAAAPQVDEAVLEMPHDAQVRDLRTALSMRSRGTLGIVASIKRRSHSQLLSSNTVLSSLGKSPIEVDALVTGHPGTQIEKEAVEALRATGTAGEQFPAQRATKKRGRPRKTEPPAKPADKSDDDDEEEEEEEEENNRPAAQSENGRASPSKRATRGTAARQGAVGSPASSPVLLQTRQATAPTRAAAAASPAAAAAAAAAAGASPATSPAAAKKSAAANQPQVRARPRKKRRTVVPAELKKKKAGKDAKLAKRSSRNAGRQKQDVGEEEEEEEEEDQEEEDEEEEEEGEQQAEDSDSESEVDPEEEDDSQSNDKRGGGEVKGVRRGPGRPRGPKRSTPAGAAGGVGAAATAGAGGAAAGDAGAAALGPASPAARRGEPQPARGPGVAQQQQQRVEGEAEEERKEQEQQGGGAAGAAEEDQECGQGEEMSPEMGDELDPVRQEFEAHMASRDKKKWHRVEFLSMLEAILSLKENHRHDARSKWTVISEMCPYTLQRRSAGDIKDRWRNAVKTYNKGSIIATVGADPDEMKPLLERAMKKMEAEGKQSWDEDAW